jgi:hypothetical protein
VRTAWRPGIPSILLLTLLCLVLPACDDDDEPGQPAPITSEGAADAPLTVEIDDPHDGRVAAIGTSYYRFTSNVSGLYWISMDNAAADLSWQLFDDGGFVGAPLETCDSTADEAYESCQIFIDDAATDYNLAVVNLDSTGTTFHLTVSGALTSAVGPCNTPNEFCFDFEDGQLPAGLITFVMSGDADWIIDDADPTRTERYSLRSGAIAHDQTSCFEFVAPGETSVIGFHWMAQSEEGGDVLALYADGVLKNVYSGTNPWSTSATYSSFGEGVVFKFCFEKNSSVSVSEDAIWVDDIWFR